jgi:hypothetical protein
MSIGIAVKLARHEWRMGVTTAARLLVDRRTFSGGSLAVAEYGGKGENHRNLP